MEQTKEKYTRKTMEGTRRSSDAKNNPRNFLIMRNKTSPIMAARSTK